MERLTNECAKRGMVDALQWLYVSKRCTFTSNTCYTAALHGNLDTLKWLRSVGTPWNQSVYSAAVLGKHPLVTEYIKSNSEYRFAVTTSNVPCAEFIGTPCVGIASTVQPAAPPAGLATACVSLGELELLQAMVAEGANVDETSCALAAKRGNLTVLRWLREDALCKWDSRTFDAAARTGQGHVIDYLLEMKCPHYTTVPQEDAVCTIL
jgi:hypothetical protein